MEEPAATWPPGTEEALRHSIGDVGVLLPILTTTDGRIIDGELRYRIAYELGVTCPRVERAPVRDVRMSHMMEEIRTRRDAERSYQITSQITKLAALRDDDGVGLYAEEVIARALGVSLDHVYESMRRFLVPGKEDVRELFPRERRNVSGRVVEAAITTADMPAPEPVVAPTPPLHEVLEYIPEGGEHAYLELKADIARNGQVTPVVLTPQGQLIDGRARWRACTELGITPATRTERDNAWETSLDLNRSRFPYKWDRLLIAAKLPVRNSPSTVNDRRPPTAQNAAAILRVQHYAARTLKRLIALDTEGTVIPSVLSEKLRLGSAIKIMQNFPKDQWEDRVNLETGNARSRPKPPSVPVKHTSRKGTLGEPQILKIQEQLDALGLILETSAGLDPAITSERAGQWMTSLSTARRHLATLNNMLKQRKETT